MTIEDFGGRHEVNSIAEFEAILRSRYGPGVNGVWLSHTNERHPAISLLVKGDLATLHYFPQEDHPGFRSVGRMDSLNRNEFGLFNLDTVEQETEIWNATVVPIREAISAVRDFFRSNELPISIEWSEL